jgi:hypothetical protein
VLRGLAARRRRRTEPPYVISARPVSKTAFSATYLWVDFNTADGARERLGQPLQVKTTHGQVLVALQQQCEDEVVLSQPDGLLGMRIGAACGKERAAVGLGTEAPAKEGECVGWECRESECKGEGDAEYVKRTDEQRSEGEERKGG